MSATKRGNAEQKNWSNQRSKTKDRKHADLPNVCVPVRCLASIFIEFSSKKKWWFHQFRLQLCCTSPALHLSISRSLSSSFAFQLHEHSRTNSIFTSSKSDAVFFCNEEFMAYVGWFCIANATDRSKQDARANSFCPVSCVHRAFTMDMCVYHFDFFAHFYFGTFVLCAYSPELV